MKLVRCLTVVALVILRCSVFSTAQGQGTSPQSAVDSKPKIETKFDSAKNETTVGFEQLLIIGTETEKLLISVEATYATQSPKKHPEDVIFIISALNYTAYRYPDINKLIITSDDKTLSPVLLLNLDKRKAENAFIETLGTRMKYDVFMKLAKAKNAQMQFTETSFSLSGDHLALLSQLADLLHL